MQMSGLRTFVILDLS
jgi:hypothetical protein